MKIVIKITSTIANEYNDRAPAFVPEECWIPGDHAISLEAAKYMRSDAEDYASSLFFDDVRPGVKRAYGALAKQIDKAISCAWDQP